MKLDLDDLKKAPSSAENAKYDEAFVKEAKKTHNLNKKDADSQRKPERNLWLSSLSILKETMVNAVLHAKASGGGKLLSTIEGLKKLQETRTANFPMFLTCGVVALQ